MPILRSLFLVLSVLLVLCLLMLAGCGPRVVKMAEATVPAGGLRLVIVEAKSAVPLGDPAWPASVTAAGEMQLLVIADLKERGIPTVGVETPEAASNYGAPGTALLALSITGIDQGDGAKRLLVGFGYGQSHLDVSARLLAPSQTSERLIAGFRTEADSGYKPGVILPLGMGVAAGGYVVATTGVNLATGLMRTPHRNIVATARAIGKTVADAVGPAGSR